MTANNKEEFFTLLEYELKRIGVENYDEIKGDFEQHFADSAEQGISEEETAFKLGDVKEIARNYLNLESSRLNSIIARDIENTGKKVSLTKPGQSVPADLSLMSGKDIQNTDCVREYTPEHISEEIYPSRDNSADNTQSNSNVTTLPDSYFTNNSNTNSTTSSDNNSNTNSNTNSTTNSTTDNSANAVADAFSNAGKAVAEAARATGQALAEAFGKNGVKGAVINAGKTTADAVRTAGQSAADAVKKATHKNDGSVPTPNDDFRENTNSSRNGTIPEGAACCKGEKSKNAFTFESIKGKEANVNGGKLIGAIIMDLLLWSWLVPLIIAGIISIFGFGIGLFVQNGVGSFVGNFGFSYHFISRIFLGIGFCALGGIVMSIAGALIKPWVKLLKHIGMLHVKAIYDL